MFDDHEVYDPFTDALSDTLDQFEVDPTVITLHSFSPTWHGEPRETEIGLLHDVDPRLAVAMHSAAEGAGYDVALNMPYSAADGVTHTLQKHAIDRGLQNVMIEVRNDLLTDERAIAHVATTILDLLIAATVSEASA